MKTVLLLGGPAAGQRVEVHGTMTSASPTLDAVYKVVPMCSHGEVHWFGVEGGADPLALLIAGYAPAVPQLEFDDALIEIAALDDTRASNHLAATGSYSWFDEPSAVKVARAALAEKGYKP